jgi:hypothetical protein
LLSFSLLHPVYFFGFGRWPSQGVFVLLLRRGLWSLSSPPFEPLDKENGQTGGR